MINPYERYVLSPNERRVKGELFLVENKMVQDIMLGHPGSHSQFGGGRQLFNSRELDPVNKVGRIVSISIPSEGPGEIFIRDRDSFDNELKFLNYQQQADGSILVGDGFSLQSLRALTHDADDQEYLLLSSELLRLEEQIS